MGSVFSPVQMQVKKNPDGSVVDKDRGTIVAPTGSLPALPGAPPDAADAAVRAAAAAERRRAMGGQGRQSTFLSGLSSGTAPAPAAPKSLLGS
jgi:hypothetical protein